MKKFTTILKNTAYTALQTCCYYWQLFSEKHNFSASFFYQRNYENIIYNFYKEKYPWYPGPSLISKPNIGLIIKQKIAPLNI